MIYINALRRLILLLILAFVFVNGANALNNVSVTATAGTGGPYATLYAAFTAINAGTFTGAINISINGNTTEPTGTPPVLNASGVGSASYTSVLIKPTVASTITGSISTAIIKLNGADNVTIDGSITPGGTTQDLTISNSNTTTSSVVIWVGSATGNGATGVTIKNCILTGNSTTTTFVGVLSGGNASISTYDPQLAANTNTTIQNNSISNMQWGIYNYGPTTAPDTGTVITGNQISSVGQLGVYLANQYNMQVNNNSITGITYTTSHATMAGINVASTLVGSSTSINGNQITHIRSTGTQTSGVGILISGAWPAGGTVNGNTINNISADSANAAGIEIFPTVSAISGGSISANNINTINSNAVVNTTYETAGAAGIFLSVSSSFSNPTNLTVSNNFIANVTARGYATAGTGNLKYNGNGIMVYSGIGYNIYFNTINLAANQTLAGQSAALYIATNGPVPSALNIKDNILVNTETTGSTYGIYSEVTKVAYSTMDYNDYYAATGLGYIASAASTTLAAMQTNFGANTHSGNILPGFTSATDLHLTGYNNFCLASGSPVAGITTDIDGDTRIAPVIGADEFTFSFSSTSAPSTCVNSNVIVTVTDPSGTLASGTYKITYSLSAPNASSGDTATIIYVAGATNAGTFIIPAALLSTAGSTTVTITSISSTVVCSAALTPVPVKVAAVSSNQAIFTVGGGTVTPSLTISAPQTTICPATPLTFTAVPVNGGATPSYQWKKNGINVGNNAATYVDSTLANNDTIICVMTSSASCASPVIAISDSLVITVSSPVAAFTDSVAGLQVSFNSSTSTGAVTYNWNFGDGTGTSALANPVYTYSSANTDTVCLTVYSGINCASTTCHAVTTIITSINPALNNNWHVFPDPVTDILFIEPATAITSIAIYDVQGREIFIEKTNQSEPGTMQLNVAWLAPGIYYLKLNSLDNTYTRPVVKR